VHFSDILTSLSGRPSICSVTSCGLTSHGYPLAGLLSCAWRLTVRSLVDGPRVPTSGYVKLLLPPRQSRGNSHFGLGPSHVYSKTASTARKICDQRSKKTFAAKSARNGHAPPQRQPSWRSNGREKAPLSIRPLKSATPFRNHFLDRKTDS